MTNPEETPLAVSSPAGSAPAGPALPANRGTQSWMILSIVVIGMVAGASVVMLMKSSPEKVSAATTATPGGASGTSTASSDLALAAITPKWSGGVRRSNGRNVAVYELEADNDVALWGKVVRPILTVRCVAGMTEVFVFTQSAAAMDQNDGKHAVRIGYDGDPDSNERWLASDDYDALFAENGVAAARHIASARTMRFGFTPYNGTYAVARFQVAGFERLAPKLAQTCRWK